MSQKEKKPEDVSRRSAIQTIGAGVLGLAVGAAAGYLGKPTVSAPAETVTVTQTQAPLTTTATVAPTTLAQPWAGTTITHNSYSPLSDGLRPLLAEFQKKTGINVNMTVYSIEEGTDKVSLNLVGRTGALDVVTAFINNVGAFAPYQEPLDPLVEKYGIDLSDFVKAGIEGMRYDDAHMFDPRGGGTKLTALPVNACIQFLAYQKDWFEDPKEKSNFEQKYGYELGPPKTWKEMCDMCEFFTRPAEDMYGYSLPGHPFYWAEHPTAAFYSRGEYYVNTKGVPTFNTENQVEAWSLLYSFYKNKWCPPGSENNDYAVANDLMLHKKVAMQYNWNFSYGSLEAPDSPVKGRIGYALMPIWGEPIGKPRDPPPGVTSWVVPDSYSRSSQGAWNLSIADSSKNKDAAFQFILWATSKDVAMKLVDSQGFVEALYSAYTDPGVQARFPFTKTMLEAWAGDHTWSVVPRCPPFMSWMSRVQPVLHEILTGKSTVKQALDKANDMMVEMWKDAGYPT